jgi:hypothetical protein
MVIVHNELVVMVMNITSYKIYFLIISPKHGVTVSDWVSYEVCELFLRYYSCHLGCLFLRMGLQYCTKLRTSVILYVNILNVECMNRAIDINIQI